MKIDVVTFCKNFFKVYKDFGFWHFLYLVLLYVKSITDPFFYKGDVLFVSGCPGGSMKYRCSNFAEELSGHGIKSKVVTANHPCLKVLTKKFKVFVLHRVIYTEKIETVIDTIKAQNKQIVFETDDLVYDGEYVKHLDYYKYMNEQEKSYYDNGIGREIISDEYVKVCTVSTEFLAEAIKKKYPDKKVYVVRNRLASDQMRFAQKTYLKRHKIKPVDGKIRIGYFSGSKSHDKDFSVISDLLIEILKSNKNVKLLIVGHLTLDEKFEQVANQIERFPMVSMKKLTDLILRADINIAPLEIDNPFCNAKSELKYFEAAILEVPTVASATNAFRHAITDGRNGFLAGNAQDWKRSLEKLIMSKELRESVGHRARADVMERYTTVTRHNETGLFVDFLHKQIEAVNRNQ